MFANSCFRQALREAAPNLSRRYFSCSRPAANATRQMKSCRILQSTPCLQSFSRQFRSSYLRQSLQLSSKQQTRGFRTSIKALQEAVRNGEHVAAKTVWAETSSNTVAYWLLASAASVFGIVVFGGLTRLTESGLSITEWKPVTGSLPPMSDADWESEFAKYRASPEFLILNSKMNLDEFKSIYWMEWIHRVWGRFVGLSFVLPAVYFIARGRVSRAMAPKLSGIAALIGFQGFLGWWMVKSGLKDDFLTPDRKPGRDVPRVSQYRLAAHLGTAFVAYLSMVWCGLSILKTNRLVNGQAAPASELLKSVMARAKMLPQFKLAVAALLGLTFTTAMSGALVAGLDAGLIYNEFPYMGLGLTPPMSELFDPFYSHDPSPQKKDLYWRNFLENPSLVQLDHRILATTTFTAVHALWAWSKFSSTLKSTLPRTATRGVHGVVGFVWLQVILGISTLIYMVPITLASAHQAGALALLTMTSVLFRRVTVPREAIQILQKRAGLSSAGATAERLGFNGIQQDQRLRALQAGLGSASAAAIGSMTLAITLNNETQSVDKKAVLSNDRLNYLRKQQAGLQDASAVASTAASDHDM